jgi:hypothetical protein
MTKKQMKAKKETLTDQGCTSPQPPPAACPPLQTKPEMITQRAAKMARAMTYAREIEADAAELNHPGHHPAVERCRADQEHRRSAELAQLPGPIVKGPGGEVTTAEIRGQDDARFKDTLTNPDTLAAAASRHRLELAGCISDDVLALALDAAESIAARDSLERMLAHQLAVTHDVIMRSLMSAERMGESLQNFGETTIHHGGPILVEVARLRATAARLMTAYQNGFATLARVRQGGRQTVTVQHVTVSDGGQAVVAGQVTPGGRPRGRDEES